MLLLVVELLKLMVELLMLVVELLMWVLELLMLDLELLGLRMMMMIGKCRNQCLFKFQESVRYIHIYLYGLDDCLAYSVY